MERYIIEGGRPLEGSVRIQGSKNTVLPVMAAALLQRGTVCLRRCPKIADVRCMVEILKSVGSRDPVARGLPADGLPAMSTQGRFRERMRIKCAPLFFFWEACCPGAGGSPSAIRADALSGSGRWIFTWLSSRPWEPGYGRTAGASALWRTSCTAAGTGFLRSASGPRKMRLWRQQRRGEKAFFQLRQRTGGCSSLPFPEAGWCGHPGRRNDGDQSQGRTQASSRGIYGACGSDCGGYLFI